MRTSRAQSIGLLLAGAFAVAPTSLRAQAYFAPLVVPPASVGTCLPSKQVPVHGDTTHVVQHHFIIRSATPGSASRDIGLITGRGKSVVYSDMSHVTVSAASWSDRSVLASTDTLGRMHGWWMRGTASVPDSIMRKHPDSATLRHLRSSIRESNAPRTPLGAADEAQVRVMTAWMLRRCP